MKKSSIKYWVEADGEKFYGPGTHELLLGIIKEGSLSKAAVEMRLSYRKAWEMVKRLNRNAEHPFVILKKGGVHGGGAMISEQAIGLMKEYEGLQIKMKHMLQEEEKSFKFLK